MKRVLVASYGGAHVAAALPLHAALQAAGYEPVMLGLTTAADVLRRHGIEPIRFLDHVDIDDPEVRRWGELLCAAHHKDGIGITRDESMAYLGASLADLVAGVGEPAALERYRSLGLNALRPERTLRRILQAERIDGVIATDSPRAERAALNAAASLSLPSVCVLTSFPHIGLEYLRREDNGAMMCVLNERIRSQLVAAGRPARSVVVTGNPAFDALIAPDNAARRNELRREHGLRENDWAVLWAEQPEPADATLPVRMRDALALACSRNGWKLVVRLHPSSQAGQTLTASADVIVSPRQQSVRDALLLCDAVVTFTSTIGFEALVLDKPVVIAAVSQYSSYVDYREEDGVAIVDSMDAVEAALASFDAGDETAQRLGRNRRQMARPGTAAASIVRCLVQQSATTSIPS